MSDEQIPPVEQQQEAPKETGTTPPPPAPPQTAGDLGELKTLIAGLPESIANAIKEAIPAAPKPTPVRRESGTKKSETPVVSEAPPSAPPKKSLRDWWFDKS